MEITYGGIISTNRWKIEDFHSVKQRWRCIIRGKGKRYLEEERIWFGKLIESTRRKRGWSVHNRSWIYLTTRDKSSRGVVPLLWSLKALGVLGIARLFLHLFGQIYGRAFIMKIDISSEGAGEGGTVWRCLARRVHQPRRIKSISGSIERPLCRLDARKDARDRLSDASIRFYNNLSQLPPFVILRYRYRLTLDSRSVEEFSPLD